MHALVAELGHRPRAPHLELPLLPVLRAFPTRLTALVPRVPRDTCGHESPSRQMKVRWILSGPPQAESKLGLHEEAPIYTATAADGGTLRIVYETTSTWLQTVQARR